MRLSSMERSGIEGRNWIHIQRLELQNHREMSQQLCSAFTNGLYSGAIVNKRCTVVAGTLYPDTIESVTLVALHVIPRSKL